jgi:hypothetical protein
MKPNFLDLSGRRFGRLVALDFRSKVCSRTKRIYWRCICDCGNELDINGAQLRLGQSKSCGCLRRELRVKLNTKHGRSYTDIYNIWANIIDRCMRTSSKHYRDYGGRGIQICQEWRWSFESFASYVGKRPSSEHSIDRINNNLGYEPGNVRWATHAEQRRNCRRVTLVEIDGETLCLKDVAIKAGLSPKTVSTRVFALGWSPEKAITTPVRKYVAAHV